jgi:hypothetical protein
VDTNTGNGKCIAILGNYTDEEGGEETNENSLLTLNSTTIS